MGKIDSATLSESLVKRILAFKEENDMIWVDFEGVFPISSKHLNNACRLSHKVATRKIKKIEEKMDGLEKNPSAVRDSTMIQLKKKRIQEYTPSLGNNPWTTKVNNDLNAKLLEIFKQSDYKTKSAFIEAILSQASDKIELV